MFDRSQHANLSEFLDSGETGHLRSDTTRRWATCDLDLICQRYDRRQAFSER
jgi:hypothetical protein